LVACLGAFLRQGFTKAPEFPKDPRMAASRFARIASKLTATTSASHATTSKRRARMSKDFIGHNQPVSDKLHRKVYQAVVGLTLWFIASAWLLFSGGADADSFLIVLTAFFLIAMAIPLSIWMVWSKQGPGADRGPGVPLRHWLAGDFDTCQYRLRGSEAAIQVLLPIAAVAFGLTAFGLVLHFTPHA
jgi:FtsH-binding integral membrane protein